MDIKGLQSDGDDHGDHDDRRVDTDRHGDIGVAGLETDTDNDGDSDDAWVRNAHAMLAQQPKRHQLPFGQRGHVFFVRARCVQTLFAERSAVVGDIVRRANDKRLRFGKLHGNIMEFAWRSR